MLGEEDENDGNQSYSGTTSGGAGIVSNTKHFQALHDAKADENSFF